MSQEVVVDANGVSGKHFCPSRAENAVWGWFKRGANSTSKQEKPELLFTISEKTKARRAGEHEGHAPH